MPQAGADGWYEFFFDTNVKSNPALMEDGSVDYQNAKWFELVKKGQTVAVYHEAQEEHRVIQLWENPLRQRRVRRSQS